MFKRFLLASTMFLLGSGVVFSQDTNDITGGEKDFSVYIPNAFTPNFDGLNDYFKIVTTGPVEYYELIILNRRGEEVFYSRDIDRVWNGSVENGEYFSSPSIFVYFLKVRAEGEVITRSYTGHIVMIR